MGLQYPHTFFNILAGGPRLGYRWLSFSNVEWGQDLLCVDDWIAKHSKDRLVAVALAYPVTPESFFEKGVIAESSLAQLLSTPDFQDEVKNRGLFLILHSTLLSYPLAESTILVLSRKPNQWIAASYQVFEFRGAVGLAQLKKAYFPERYPSRYR